MISIKNLSKAFKNKIVLNNLDIDFESRINFLLGDNGEGKTVLINILAGIVKPDKGIIQIDNKKIDFSDGRYKKNIGFLLNLQTYPAHLKIKEYIDLLNAIYSINTKENKVYLDELIIFFQLNKYLDHKISELSTGYIMRVKLFASMLHDPSIYIYDEPFSGIDKKFVPLLIAKIIELSAKGKTFLITTHLSKITSYNFSDRTNYQIANGKISKIT